MAARPPDQYSFGSKQVEYDPSHVRTGVTNTQWGAAKTVSADDLLRVLGEVCSASKASGLKLSKKADNKALDALYLELWDKYKEFARELPVIFRWTVYHQSYSEVAFRHYITHHHKPIWKDRKEMVTAQAEYIIRKRQIDNPRNGYSAKYRTWLVDKLKTEAEEYEAASEEAQKQAEAGKAEQLKLMRAAVYQAALAAQSGHAI